MPSAPIIFCHYGDSDYLRYTLSCARRTNPTKRIILLGDKANRWHGRYVEHHPFEDYSAGEETEIFTRVYKLIQGAKHNHERSGNDWVNFVFKRWYYIYNFIRANQISGFWHFDSDTMIVEALEKFEAKYSAFDCTEQCDGSCMNGYISSPEIVGRYLLKINELFQRPSYLKEQAEEFESTHPNYAFTEMRAYEVFRQEEGVKSVRLSHVNDGSMFDDTVFLAQGMESERLRSGKFIKKIFLEKGGRFFCRDRHTAQPIQVNSLNLSWLPQHTFPIILHHARAFRGATRDPVPAAPSGRTLASRIDSPIERLFWRIQLKIKKRLFGRQYI